MYLAMTAGLRKDGLEKVVLFWKGRWKSNYITIIQVETSYTTRMSWMTCRTQRSCVSSWVLIQEPCHILLDQLKFVEVSPETCLDIFTCFRAQILQKLILPTAERATTIILEIHILKNLKTTGRFWLALKPRGSCNSDKEREKRQHRHSDEVSNCDIEKHHFVEPRITTTKCVLYNLPVFYGSRPWRTLQDLVFHSFQCF